MRRIVRAVPAVLLVASLAALFAPRGAETVPLFAGRQALQCQMCHFDPDGGGPRNAFGFIYAKQRHSLEPEAEDSPFADLQLSNRIGENVPITIGVNQRFMMLANSTVESDSLDRFGFFNMQNALHVAIEPHERLTLVYTRDGFNSGSHTQEAWGLIKGLPLETWLKAGRLRNPFGLRMDDHTVATRNGFLDFSPGGRFLPFDPRRPDMGLELGRDGLDLGLPGLFFARAALTNGGDGAEGIVFQGGTARAHTLKLGYTQGAYMGAISFYDDLVRGVEIRRIGYYAARRHGPFTGIVEVGTGTDEAVDRIGKLALFGEVNYQPSREWNLRVRYDRLELDRDPDNETIRRNNTYDRYALEGEWTPVPFAELRAVLRRIEHAGVSSLGRSSDETQAYLQFHFAY